MSDQIWSLCDVMALSAAQTDASWVSQAIDADMDFRAEATSVAPHHLGGLHAIFLFERIEVNLNGGTSNVLPKGWAATVFSPAMLNSL